MVMPGSQRFRNFLLGRGGRQVTAVFGQETVDLGKDGCDARAADRGSISECCISSLLSWNTELGNVKLLVADVVFFFDAVVGVAPRFVC